MRNSHRFARSAALLSALTLGIVACGTQEPPAPTYTNYAAVNFGGAALTDNGVSYMSDMGAEFAATSGTMDYGWSTDAAARVRNRSTTHTVQNCTTSSDTRMNTFVAVGPSTNPAYSTATWEMEVPNGTYRVTVGAGDPCFNDSTTNGTTAGNGISVEGTNVPFGANMSTTGGLLQQGTVTDVAVNDGRLTVTAAAGATNPKISYIIIQQRQ